MSPSATAARAPGTDRHSLAQDAGLRALHICSGYFATEAPRALVDQTISANAPDAAKRKLEIKVDEQAKSVSVRFDDLLPPRIAVYRSGMGCTMLPIGASHELAQGLFRPTLMAPRMDDKAWPMGDRDAIQHLPRSRQKALDLLIAEAFRDQAGLYGGVSWGILILKGGKIVTERYQHGFSEHVAARTNSMCKSLGATLVGVGVRKGLIDLKRKAVLPEWRTPGDPRGDISVNDLLHMASGLYSDGAQDPQHEIYRSGASIGEAGARNMVDAKAGARFVYAGTDTNLAMRALRTAFADDQHYPAFPYEQLLWKIGMTRTIVETDWNNDFIVSGQCWSTARDFARLGLLYLSNGQWAGEQLLPADWSRYVSTPAPAQPVKPSIGGDAGYGAQFWLFGGMEGLPPDAYSAFGAMGQYAVIIPSADIVIVRRGFDDGSPFRIQKFAADVVHALNAR
ncbi:serine hydrolase [Sphingobium sp. H39-3-25]|uniref:serine hydrolase domain-containing protein n=1 Tax=Sphingobium arseniciresistens TaxID=3030834 RepID=UPI0023B8F21D|nr:serine hydrolase [Sphingobium arseniciresistens]